MGKFSMSGHDESPVVSGPEVAGDALQSAKSQLTILDFSLMLKNAGKLCPKKCLTKNSYYSESYTSGEKKCLVDCTKMFTQFNAIVQQTAQEYINSNAAAATGGM